MQCNLHVAETGRGPCGLRAGDALEVTLRGILLLAGGENLGHWGRVDVKEHVAVEEEGWKKWGGAIAGLFVLGGVGGKVSGVRN